MKILTDGIIIREQIIKESDKMVTILTRDRGIVQAYASGAKNIKSPKSTGTCLLTYSQFVLFKYKDKYTIDEAHPKELFIKIRNNVEKLTLAQYFCELAGAVVQEEEESEYQLRLILNSIYFLAKGEMPDQLIKGLFEMRLMALSGFMPELVACHNCGCYEHDEMTFFSDSAILLCGDCAGSSKSRGIVTGKNVTMALRHCAYADFNKLFSLSLKADALPVFSKACEIYVLDKTGRKFKTLDFYKTLQSM